MKHLPLFLLVVLLAACGTELPAMPAPDASNDAPEVEASADASADAPTDGEEDAFEVEAPDAARDAVAVVDAAVDAPRDSMATDAARDAVAVVDAAVDAPPPDPLTTERPAEVRASVLYAATCSRPGCKEPARAVAGSPMCSVSPAGVVQWSLRACSSGGPPCDDLAGDAVSVSVVSGSGGVTAPAPRVTLGSPYSAGGVMRRGARVQFAAPASDTASGVTGIPGRTMAPMLGEVLLLGCPVR